MPEPTAIPTKTFRERYCEAFHCPQRHFGKRVLWECLHPEGRKLAVVIRPAIPVLLAEDLELIEQVGELSDLATVTSEINDFSSHNPPKGLIRRKMNVRVSGRLLLRLARKVL